MSGNDIRDDEAAHRAARDLAPSGAVDTVDLAITVDEDRLRIVAMSANLSEDLANLVGTPQGLASLLVDIAEQAETCDYQGYVVTTGIPKVCRIDEVWIEQLGPGWAWICYPDDLVNG